MPGLDRRGPEGMGPMTGGGRGRCTPYGRRAGRRYFGQQPGWGGRGRGWRHWSRGYGSPRWGWGQNQSHQTPYYETFYTRDEEMAQLKEEAAMLEEELEGIEQRLNQLEKSQGA